MERNKYTLLELSKIIVGTIKNSFPGSYWLVAEINELRENMNGHCYLELIEKDQDQEQDRIVARSRATIWAHTWRMLRSYFETSTSQTLSKGMLILVEVTVEFHELYGMSLNIKDIDPVYTMGDLERKRAETLKKLEKEGILSMNKGLPFPMLPSRIAVISSPSAAGYEDFIHQIKNNPKKYHFELTLFPAIMQGENTVHSITSALESIFNQEKHFDVVVILRGGGSTTDLSSFDNYEIAAHIAQLPLPVITGIGHERDITIAGMVANTDLKTPTAVAEFLTGKLQELDTRIKNISVRLANQVTHTLEKNHHNINTIVKELPILVKNNMQQKGRYLKSRGSIITVSASGFIQKNSHKLNSLHSGFGYVVKNHLLRLKNYRYEISTRILPDKIRTCLRNNSDKMIMLHKTMEMADPQNILKKGYTVVHKNGKIVKSVEDINKNDLLETKFHDGRINSKVLNINDKRRNQTNSPG